DWPIRYKDIAPWYDYVEKFIGVSGNSEGLAHLPDGQFQKAMELNCIETHFRDAIRDNYKDRLLTVARVANLTESLGSRGKCMNRNLCLRGCPFGAYFSSNSSTIPAAMATGNLTLRPFSIVSEVIYDEKSGKATGVRVTDAETFETHEYFARILFINASTIATTALLLNSKSSRFPDGLGNDSGELGHNLMDHHSSAGAAGYHDGFGDKYYKGRRPCGFLIPRYRNIHDTNKSGSSFLRGYNIQGDGERKEWQDIMGDSKNIGVSLKKTLSAPGTWQIWMGGWGECLPYHDNRIRLHGNKKDKWGIPQVEVDFEFKENEKLMMDDIKETCSEMLAKAGFKGVNSFNYNKVGGATVHEMGTARMGRDPKTSVLNQFNQIHTVKNVFVTDGSCMASSACQNPSLTYMALTARACNYAFDALKRGDL
ncbi:MAG TPA: GMC family oxidoreductase, partial [Niabella sp.]|nr:GMC family oxidoreductase [Niabella sp.]